MPASCSVAKSAIEAPTGPDGVRPCACTGTGIATPTSKKRNSHAPARCMRGIIQKTSGGHQRAIRELFVTPNGTPTSKKRNSHAPARCMRGLYRRQVEGTSVRSVSCS